MRNKILTISSRFCFYNSYAEKRQLSSVVAFSRHRKLLKSHFGYMPYPVVKRYFLKHDSFSKHPVLYSYYYLVSLFLSNQVNQDLELPIVL